MKNSLWDKYSMGKGWEWVILPLLVVATIIFIVIGNWLSVVLAMGWAFSEARAWILRIRKEQQS